MFDWEDRVLVIGEVGQSHDGSLGTAHAFIDAIADAGADAVKFQTHIAAAESRRDEPWRIKFSYEDETRYEYWKRVEFTPQAWEGLRRHANDRGLSFLSSPFSLEAVELLRRVGVDAWKVASGEVANPLLLSAVAKAGQPVLLSSGMSSWAEVDEAVERLRGDAAGPLVVLQCTSSYPTVPERLGLNVLEEIVRRYRCSSGLSDHSGTMFPSLAAVALGARVVEVHVTMSREMFGPDVPASVTTHELRTLVDGVRYLDRALAAPVDKDAIANEMSPMRELFGRSLVARTELSAGQVLASSDIVAKKPGGGIPPSRLEALVGQTLCRRLKSDEPFLEQDFENASGEGECESSPTGISPVGSEGFEP